MSIFSFKQFTIHQELCAMKVGTDGVLLGAWAGGNNIETILDIGTGTGVIACMMAQKFMHATIDAIDIDTGAFNQCKINMHNSPWANRLHVEHIALNAYNVHGHKKYDCIISNPPYFSKGWAIDNMGRKLARDASYLPHQDLIIAAIAMLNDNGSLHVIYPFHEAHVFMQACKAHNVFCKRQTHVYSKYDSPVKRVLMEIVKTPCNCEQDNLIIHNADTKSYTEAYKQLTKDFYIHF